MTTARAFEETLNTSTGLILVRLTEAHAFTEKSRLTANNPALTQTISLLQQCTTLSTYVDHLPNLQADTVAALAQLAHSSPPALGLSMTDNDHGQAIKREQYMRTLEQFSEKEASTLTQHSETLKTHCLNKIQEIKQSLQRILEKVNTAPHPEEAAHSLEVRHFLQNASQEVGQLYTDLKKYNDNYRHYRQTLQEIQQNAAPWLGISPIPFSTPSPLKL